MNANLDDPGKFDLLLLIEDMGGYDRSPGLSEIEKTPPLIEIVEYGL